MSQNTRIHELEVSRNDLKRQVADLQTRRDEAEQALLEAIIAGREAKKEREEWEEIIATLKQQITSLTEERNKAEREIEELRSTEMELRRELHEQKQKVSRLEAENEALERSSGVVSTPAAAASTVDPSSRRGSVGESERRRHGHARRSSSGSWITILDVKLGDDKEEKKKKKKSGRK